MQSEKTEIVRQGMSIFVSKQDDGSFKLQKSGNLELLTIADLKGNALMFRKKAKINGVPHHALVLDEKEMKLLEE